MELEQITNRIIEILKAEQSSLKKPFFLAIDGRCASGKTTLAAQLESKLSCSVFHIDDFFLPVQKRSAMPGGNIDYARIKQEMIQPCKEGASVLDFCPFDCHAQSLLQPVKKYIKPLVVIEGSYSCHPLLFNFYDFHIFLTINQEEQKNRIIARNGEAVWNIFEKQWIPLEEKYFSYYQIQQKCAYCFETV